MCFKYLSGEFVEQGDVVKTDILGQEEEAFVFFVAKPHSRKAMEISQDEGGVMFCIGSEHSLMLVAELNEHFVFVSRKK